MALATDLFDYDLPERLIAQTPAARRDASRLLVVDRARREIIAHTVFAELPAFLRAGDTLFRNNAAVLPARLHARRPTGGAVECLLLRPAGDAAGCEWWCLVRPGRKLPPGATFASEASSPSASASGTPTDGFSAEVVAVEPGGTARVRFTTPAGEDIVAVANRLGAMPLPPYIARDHAHDAHAGTDRARYQTVYADAARQVAVAAPTAGLHFTPELLEKIAAAGVATADVTLHVGLGTFKPITTATVEEHAIHRETYEIPPTTQAALFGAPAADAAAAPAGVTPGAQARGRRIAVGTTTVRTVEDFLAKHPAPQPHAVIDEAALFIHPPATFRGVDALITNFHQPRSTLLCLVSAFLTPGSTDGIAWLREIYAEAIARDYRFFSYGDAMLIL